MSRDWVPWTWLDFVRVISFALALVLIAALALGGVLFGLRLAEHHQLLQPLFLTRLMGPYRVGIVVLLLTVIAYGAALLAIRRYTIKKYRLRWSALYLQHVGWRRYGAMVWLFIPMQLGAGAIVWLQTKLAGHTLDNPQQGVITHVTQHHLANVVAVFVAAAVIAPIVEEVTFRGFFYRLLRKKLPVWAAVPISAAVFAAAHGFPVLIPVLFYIGVVLALVVEKTKSLYCSMILHALQNAIAIVAIARGHAGI